MKSAKILQVQVTQKGNALVFLAENPATPIIRSEKAFLAELKGSSLIPNGVGINSPLVRNTIRNLSGGIVFGNFDFQKKGTPYEIIENSKALTDPNHRLYGSVKLGDTVESDNDRYVVDYNSMLSFRENARAEDTRNRVAIEFEMSSASEDIMSMLQVGNAANAIAEDTDDTNEGETTSPDFVIPAEEVEEPKVEEPKAKAGKATAKK